MALHQGTPPRGVFQGTNFMTPDWVGYYKLRTGWAELSTGRGMENQPIFGVTVRRHDGTRFSPDPSKLFQSKPSALSYIEDLS